MRIFLVFFLHSFLSFFFHIIILQHYFIILQHYVCRILIPFIDCSRSIFAHYSRLYLVFEKIKGKYKKKKIGRKSRRK